MIRRIGIDLDHLEVIADELLLDAQLVASFICVESSGNPWAWKPEPPYRYLWDVAKGRPFRALTHDERMSEVAPKDFPVPAGADREAEWWGQQISWGLMQVMGGVARERGFSGVFLTQLCDPAEGVWVGCRHLAALLRRYRHLPDTIAAYNAGSPRKLATGVYENQQYVDKVLDQLGRLKDGADELEREVAG